MMAASKQHPDCFSLPTSFPLSQFGDLAGVWVVSLSCPDVAPVHCLQAVLIGIRSLQCLVSRHDPLAITVLYPDGNT